MTSQVNCITKQKRTLSFGAGIDTFFMLFNYPERYDVVLHCDIANGDREHGEGWVTYWLIDNFAIPFCKENNIPFVILTHKDGGVWERSLKKHMLPMLKPRWCTQDHKIALMRKFIRTKLKANFPNNVVLSDIGFTFDEIERLNNYQTKVKYNKEEYPLIDKRITRQECIDWLNKNKPIVINGNKIDWKDCKSGCWFCPFWNKKKLLKLTDKQKNEMIMLEENAKLGKGRKWKEGISFKSYLYMDTTKLDLYLDDRGCNSGHCYN